MSEESANLLEAERIIARLRDKLAEVRASRREPIAIVGFAARTPFESQGVSLWEGFSKGVDASTGIPSNRWDAESFYDPTPQVPGKSYTKRGSFLADVASFDANFFAIAPIEAKVMDPQQRIVLETVWEALGNAGLSLDVVRRCRTGVFMGVCSSDYGFLSFSSELTAGEAYVGTGNLGSVISGRVSYALGLTGPSLVVDTACSSSLVSVHLACESLRTRSSDIAVAGGVNLLLSPHANVFASNLGALSADGRCRTFDAKGTGFGRGEGCGVVLLKRLSDAIRDNDRILALIRGSAVNQDGRSDGLTAPNGLAQQEAIRAALEFAKIAPGDVQYVEAHGTGTILGDPIEVEALSEVFGGEHTKESPLVIGSAKSNIGHLEGASGIAGLIKLVLSIQHREIPPNIHFQTPNPHIPWAQIPLRVQTKLGPWPEPGRPLVAGVSSFGISGTNAHVVLSEAPAIPPDTWQDADRRAKEAKALPLCVSAKSQEALRAYVERFVEYLEAPLDPATTWCDVAYTSCVRSSHLSHRLVVTGSSVSDWVDKLRAYLKNAERRPGVVVGSGASGAERALFVFSGQGSQWWGMGRDLIESEAVFRETLESCEQQIRKHAEWSLLEELSRSAETTRLHRTDIAQPALVALQIGLVRLLASWGVEPSAVVGHSVGEISAAYAAGILSLEQACQVATIRGRVMHKASGLGKMVWARLARDKAERITKDFSGRLVVGAYNGPESIVFSGETSAVDKVVEMLAAQGVETKALRVDYAFHSPEMDRFKSELTDVLSSLRPSPAQVPIFSTLTGKEGEAFDASYWARQMREPVQFVDAVKSLFDWGLPFIEVGPHPVLLASIDEVAAHAGKHAKVFSTLRRDVDQTLCMYDALAGLHCSGYALDWQKVFGVRGRVVTLPSYPWQREHFWLPLRRGKAKRGGTKWPLIDTHVRSSARRDEHVLEVELDPTNELYAHLFERPVSGGVRLTSAALIEIALEVASAISDDGVVAEGVSLSGAALSSDAGPTRLQIVVTPETGGGLVFRMASRAAKEGSSEWVEQATGRFVIVRRPDRRSISLGPIKARCSDGDVTFAEDEELGAAGQAIEQAWRGPREALSSVVGPDKLPDHSSGYVVHSSLLNAAFQTTKVALQEFGSRYVVEKVGKVSTLGEGTPRWVHATVRPVTDDVAEGDVVILDESGQLIVEMTGLRLVGAREQTDKLDEAVFEVVWRASESKDTGAFAGRWLLLADRQVASGVRAFIEERGGDVVTVSPGDGFTAKDATHYEVNLLEPEPLRRLLKEVYRKEAPNRVVHLLSLDTRTPGGPLDQGVLRKAEDLSCVTSLHLAQAVAQMGWSEPPRLFFVTRGCQPVTGSHDVQFPEQALLWGLGASLMHEMSELAPTLIDVDASSETSVASLAAELASTSDENRIAFRGSGRFLARLSRHSRQKQRGVLRPLSVAGEEAYTVDASAVGHLDSLTLRPSKISTPGPGEVVIRIKASTVDERDVRLALGESSGAIAGRLPLGSDCAGIVHSVGDGVDSLRPGDEVMALTPFAFDAYVVAPAWRVIRKPSSLTFEQASTLPSAAMTVLRALGAGALTKGERILIHPATGGVGLAAVQYAQHVGADIYATAESDEDRALLRELGVAHVYDSRTPAWSEELKVDTDGDGVHVVLNTVSSEAVAKGLSVTMPFGRFVHVTRDARENDVSAEVIRRSITFSTVAIDQLSAARPAAARSLLEDAVRLIETRVFAPPRLEVFPVSRIKEAFEYQARGRQIGRAVVTSEDTVTVLDEHRSERVRPDETYLIAGGLGQLGLVVAKRLARLGAKHIALLGRSAPQERARDVLRELEESGVRVYLPRADVSKPNELKSALASLQQSAPRLAGVVHAAVGNGEATPINNLSAGAFEPALSAKVAGTLALEDAIPDLTWRVYFSSASVLLSSGGLAHHTAANAFLDAFAHYLAGRSKHGLSLDWGPWKEAAKTSDRDRADVGARQGLAMFSPDEGAELFERLLQSSRAQLVPMVVDFRQWRQINPHLANMPLLREMTSHGRSARDKTGVLERIRAATSVATRVLIIENYIIAAVARVLQSTPESISRTVPFKQLGFDSLMTVSLKNVLESELEFPLSTPVLFAHPSVGRLAVYLAEKLHDDRDAAAAAAAMTEVAPADAADASLSDSALDEAVEGLSVEELRRLVLEE